LTTIYLKSILNLSAAQTYLEKNEQEVGAG